MANIVIKEILASDTVSDLVDKVNFNFDQLLLNGGGPAGPIGGSGPAGPLGPRGSIWFTANDIYNTSATTTPDPPLVFPLWSGTPQKVNNSALPGYPQFALDPNRYLPAAETVTGTYPENSFIIGTTGKIPRSGDLYLQETDDTFDSLSSTDGDIWEFNGVNQTWTYTGVNIKGDTGTTGANGFTEWVRTNDASPALNDFLRPEIITANDPIVRVVIGVGDATQASDIITDGSVYTDNVLTLFSEAPSLGNPESYRSQISLTDEYSIQAPTYSTYDYANIYTVNNTLNIYGFNAEASNFDVYNVNMVARSGNVLLESINPVLTSTLSALLNTNSRQFEITNGALSVSVPPVTPSNANTSGSIVTHRLADTSVALDITHNSNLSSSYSGYWPIGAQGKSIRLLTTDQNTGASQTYLNLQTFANGRVGIGYFGAAGINNVNGKLAINGGSNYPSGSSVSISVIPSIIVGSSWSNSTAITFTRFNVGLDSSITGNSIFFQGQLSSARNPALTTDLYNFGPSDLNSINVFSSINMQQGMIGFNTHKQSGVATLAGTQSTEAGGNWFIAPGSWLNTNISAITITDLDNALIIGGNSVNQTGTSSYTAIKTSILIDSVNDQVLINSLYRLASDNVTRMPNLISNGGAIIGKVKNTSTSSIFGNEDSINNKNIIIGYGGGTSNISPRIVTTLAGNTVTTSKAYSIYLSTPVFTGSMLFDQSDEIHTATNTSKSSFSVGPYSSYLPSLYSQFKLVHGTVNFSGGASSILDTLSNYGTGLGLEIESRFSYGPNSTLGANSTVRTPVIRYTNGIPLTGNRPLLITKREVTNTYQPVVLFEVSPTNHVSVGSALRFPSKIVYTGAEFSKASTATVPYYDFQSGGSQLNTTSTNRGRWADIPQASSVLTDDYSRSFIVNDINFDSFAGDAPAKLDQFAATVRAGIIINNRSYTNGTQTTSVNAAYLSYKNSITPSFPIITTPPISYSTSAGNARYGIATGNPLGMKPGYIVYDDNSGGQTSSFVKGVDTLIEGGDSFYTGLPGSLNASTGLPINQIRAGDVYITGGQVYKDVVGVITPGNVSARIDGFRDPTSLDFMNFGSVYLGTRLSSYSGAGYTAPGPSAAGYVYVGYDANVPGNFTSTSTKVEPIGGGRLNVSAPTQSVEVATSSSPYRSVNRAINIQRGDIVTRNQAAGWTVINLRDSAFLNQISPTVFESENIFCYNGTNKPTLFYSPASAIDYGVIPVWRIHYKVIGYTVHYSIALTGLRWNVNLAEGNANLIFISNSNNIFDIQPNSILPRPEASTPVVYTGSAAPTNSYNLPENIEGVNFSGSGHMVLRNSPSDTDWPRGGAGQFSPVTTTPIAAIYDRTLNRISIYKSGASMFTSNTIGDYSDPHVLRFLSSSNLIPIDGLNMGGNAFAAGGTPIFADIYISGTYQLDPAEWFPS